VDLLGTPVVQLTDIGLGLAAGPPRARPIGGRQRETRAQAAARAPGHGGHDLHIPDEGVGCCGRERRVGPAARALLLQAQDQQWITRHQITDRRRTREVGLIQPTDLPRTERVGTDRLHEAQTVGAVGARQRHQVLHRRMRDNPALLHALLDHGRKIAHQTQPARHPTHTAIKASRQVLQGQAVILMQRAQHPAVLERTVRGFGVEHLPEDQRLGFPHRPGHGVHGVAVQPLETAHAFVPIDHHVRGLGHGHHDDRHLLARVGQRGQQPSFAGRMADPQVGVAKVELVKFEIHQQRLVRKADCRTAPIGSCAASRGSQSVSPLESTS